MTYCARVDFLCHDLTDPVGGSRGVAAMYLSAERLALANQTVKETFEQCSVAWQTIPHWDTGDPSQTEVPNDSLTAFAFVPLTLQNVDFTVTLAQAIAPMPDMVLETIIANTVQLAAKVDTDVFPSLLTATTPTVHIPWTPSSAQILAGLIAARVDVENAGYRAPSCLVTDTVGVVALSTALMIAGYPPGPELLLDPANINSLQRVQTLAPATDPDVRGWLLGRRQRIADKGAAAASAGEEAVDLAVSVPPSLEVVGDSGNLIQLRVRIRYATRVKDQGGLVVIRVP
jgi:hypothetical protein